MRANEFINEGVITDLTLSLVPGKLMSWLKGKVHAQAYKSIIELQKKLEQSQNISPDLALVKAAQVHGIDPKEIINALSKD